MKRDYYIPYLVVALGVAFAAISFLLWLRNGKSPLLTAKKMRLGALLLTLTAVTNGYTQDGTVMCYRISPGNLTSKVRPNNIVGLSVSTSSRSSKFVPQLSLRYGYKVVKHIQIGADIEYSFKTSDLSYGPLVRSYFKVFSLRRREVLYLVGEMSYHYATGKDVDQNDKNEYTGGVGITYFTNNRYSFGMMINYDWYPAHSSNSGFYESIVLNYHF